MNKINTFLLAVIIVSMLGISIIVGQSAGLFSITDDAVTVNANSGDYIGVPAYGTLQCKPSLQGNEVIGFGDNMIGAGRGDSNWELTGCDAALSLHNGCTVKLKMPSANDVKYLNGKRTEDAYFYYGICDLNSNCGAFGENPDALQNKITLRNLFVTRDVVDDVISINLGPNDYVVMVYSQRTPLQALWSDGSGENEISMWYEATPYYVYRDDTFSINNGKQVPQTFDCAMEGNYAEENLFITGIQGDGDLEDLIETSGFTDISLIRQKGASVTYLSNIVAVVPQYQFFDNGDKYCYDKKVWQVEEIQTTGGSYMIADTSTNNPIEAVECCNNLDVPVGYSCNSNFEKIPVEDIESCNVFQPCPYTSGIAAPGPSFITQSCIGGECVDEIINVECNFNSDCGTTEVCEQANNPRDNKCVSREDQNTGGSSNDIDNLLLYVLGGLAGLALLGMIASNVKKGQNGGPINLG